MYKLFFKRSLDIVLSGFSLIILAPVMLIVALLIRIKLGSPVIYAVPRPGMNEKIFILFKFRSMSNERDSSGQLLPDNIRLTKFGHFLRSTSLDELPELFNIFKGDMSIVGPRPLAVQYLPFYSEIERRRHDVRPGLTGLAQIRSRNELTWESKFANDIEYVNNISFISDFKIIFKTLMKLFKRDEIGIRGISSAEDFDRYRKKQIDNRMEGQNYEY
jgi:lipopolysaccharide/colanic/teichoic acid biosynthesis glycosyltransferase